MNSVSVKPADSTNKYGRARPSVNERQWDEGIQAKGLGWEHDSGSGTTKVFEETKSRDCGDMVGKSVVKKEEKVKRKNKARHFL